MSQDGRHLGAPATLPDVRPRGLLRFLKKQARHQTFSLDQAPHCPLLRARRKLDVVLRRRINARRRLNRRKPRRSSTTLRNSFFRPLGIQTTSSSIQDEAADVATKGKEVFRGKSEARSHCEVGSKTRKGNRSRKLSEKCFAARRGGTRHNF